MSRIGTVVVVVIVVLASVALPAFGVETTTSPITDETTREQTEPTTATDGNESGRAETAPGTRLAGAIGVQGAEIGGELESRSLAHQLNRSASNDSKAAVVARQANQSERRLAALRAESTRLEAARENGTISENEYRVRTAQLSARITTVRRVTDRTTAAATALPDEALRRNGVDVTTLRSLRTRANELGGARMSAVAREVVGPTADAGFGPDRAGNRTRGPPAEPGADAPGRNDGQREQRPSGERPDDAGENAQAGDRQSGDRRDGSSARNENATGEGSSNGSGSPDESSSSNESGPPNEGGPSNADDGEGGQGENGSGGPPDDPGRSGEARERESARTTDTDG
ncbi:hypothetical protein [Salinigranum salinum]|uniref:hypothetical protein n=1 Tax=Salinigranum salinum TaxID=1364937 RepID=UPI0012605E24|nr:hypothetical protein [Salinigranum salinum]